MIKLPYDSISEFKAGIFEDVIEQNIEWIYFTVIDVIANLPTYRPIRVKQSDTLVNDLSLVFDIRIKAFAGFIFFTDIVWRRSYD